MSVVRVGPGGIPSRESAEMAVQLLVQKGYDACGIDFGDGFWMDRDYARRLGTDRSATVIAEAPDEASNQAIRAVLKHPHA